MLAFRDRNYQWDGQAPNSTESLANRYFSKVVIGDCIQLRLSLIRPESEATAYASDGSE